MGSGAGAQVPPAPADPSALPQSHCLARKAPTTRRAVRRRGRSAEAWLHQGDLAPTALGQEVDEQPVDLLWGVELHPVTCSVHPFVAPLARDVPS